MRPSRDYERVSAVSAPLPDVQGAQEAINIASIIKSEASHEKMLCKLPFSERQVSFYRHCSRPQIAEGLNGEALQGTSAAAIADCRMALPEFN